MPSVKTSKRTKCIVTGVILLLIVLLLCLIRCNDDKDEIQKPQTIESLNPEIVNDTTVIDTIDVDDESVVTECVNKKCYTSSKKKNVKKIITERKCDSSLEKTQTEDVKTEQIDYDKNETSNGSGIIGCSSIVKFSKSHEFRVGVKAGAGYSRISSLGGMFEDYSIRPHFNLKEKGNVVFRGGVFSTWQYGRIGAEFGIDYIHQTGKMEKTIEYQNVLETTKFSSDMVAPQLMFRFYPFKDIYMSVGTALAIPFHSKINYSTNKMGTVYKQQDELTSEHLNQTIKSRVQLMPSFKIGYLHRKTGIETALEYNYGISDLYHTRTNDYGIMERDNKSYYVGVSVGYSIELNKDRHEDK